MGKIESRQRLLAQVLLMLGPERIVGAGLLDHACEGVFVKVHGELS
jgi:hypothetical protein